MRYSPCSWRIPLLNTLVVCATPAFAQPPARNALRPQPAPPLRFEFLGPASGGRFAAVAGVPGDTMTYYLGAASGGVWKSTDGGQTADPVFDDQPVQAIGALAVAPSAPTIVWAGTGEAWAIRDADQRAIGLRDRLQGLTVNVPDDPTGWRPVTASGTGRPWQAATPSCWWMPTRSTGARYSTTIGWRRPCRN